MITELVKNFFGALMEGLGLLRGRQAANNTGDMRSNADAEQVQADREQVRKDMAASDQTKLNEDLAP